MPVSPLAPPGYQQVPNIYKNSTPEQIAQHAAIVKSNAALMRAWRASGGYAAAVAQRDAVRNPVAAPAASPFGAAAPTAPTPTPATSVGASPFGATPTGASPFAAPAPSAAPSSPFGAPSAPPVTTVQPVRQPTPTAKLTPRRDAKAAANAVKKLTKMKDAVSV